MSVIGYSRLIYLFLFIIDGWGKNTGLNCMGISTCGYTVPSGDINLRYGQEPLEITCTLYSHMFPPNVTASSILYFKRGNNVTLYPNRQYDILDESDERVEVLNSTSIKLVIKKPRKMSNPYYCYCHYNGQVQNACSNYVVVGIPPQNNITDFTCRSDNWEKMFCSWTPPNNYVVTTYNVSYTFPEYKKQQENYVTLSPGTDEKNIKMNFTLGEKTFPFYLPSQNVFNFTVKMSNRYGNSTFSYVWDHFENIILHPPEALTGKSLSTNAIHLRWNLSKGLPAFPRVLIYKIMYKCNSFCDSWKEVPDLEYKPKSTEKEVHYNLTDLEYAHTLYDIRVRVKVECSSDDTLSNYSSVVVKTDSKIPDYPPLTTVGSFQLEDDRVYVYFQKIRPQSENGEDFKYIVESSPRLNMTELTSAYAKFVGLKEGTRYTMNIWSTNNIGNSTGHSVVYIPSKPAKRPMRLWKIVHTSTKYELEWKPPPNMHEQENKTYTLFWCEHKYERPFQCDGVLNWTVIPGNLTKYNVTVRPTNQIYQFAIAANGLNGSSGMLWASCTILPNREVLKINDLIIKSTGKYFIELNWRQDCLELSNVIGYVIYYCTTADDQKDKCDSPMKNVTINASLSEQYSAKVTNLQPYRTYLLAVSVKTKTSIGARSYFVRNNTLEAAPSGPPLDVEVIANYTTNSSVTIRWKPPTEINGKMDHYIIKYNKQTQKASGDSDNYTLTDLESFKKYNISVSACTKECSVFSSEIDVFTKMGVPDAPSRPFVESYDDNSIIISWNKPHNPRGTIKYYQIIITATKDKVTPGEIINSTNSEMFSYHNCRADSELTNQDKYIRVRAVNVIDNEDYPGQWSEPLNITNCNHSDTLKLLLIIVGIVIVLVVLGLSIKRVYDRCAVMKRLEVVLPPGLASLEEPSEKNKTDINRFYPDEELLLDKIAEKCPTRDSSGCSSGQESITSSNESTAHLSIDSGTDQTRSVADEKENSLRLRNVSSKGYVQHDPTPTVNRGTKPAPSAPGNYCVLGVDPSTKPAQDTPYVTISDVDAATSPYISNDKPPSGQPYPDFFKTPNPGYVPFSNPEPASKNTDYVVAGDLSLPSVEAKTAEYVLADTTIAPLKPSTIWQQPAVEPSLTKPGYVSVGDAPAPVKEISKGYVPHRQFEAKSLKED